MCIPLEIQTLSSKNSCFVNSWRIGWFVSRFIQTATLVSCDIMGNKLSPHKRDSGFSPVVRDRSWSYTGGTTRPQPSARVKELLRLRSSSVSHNQSGSKKPGNNSVVIRNKVNVDVTPEKSKPVQINGEKKTGSGSYAGLSQSQPISRWQRDEKSLLSKSSTSSNKLSPGEDMRKTCQGLYKDKVSLNRRSYETKGQQVRDMNNAADMHDLKPQHRDRAWSYSDTRSVASTEMNQEDQGFYGISDQDSLGSDGNGRNCRVGHGRDAYDPSLEPMMRPRTCSSSIIERRPHLASALLDASRNNRSQVKMGANGAQIKKYFQQNPLPNYGENRQSQRPSQIQNCRENNGPNRQTKRLVPTQNCRIDNGPSRPGMSMSNQRSQNHPNNFKSALTNSNDFNSDYDKRKFMHNGLAGLRAPMGRTPLPDIHENTILSSSVPVTNGGWLSSGFAEVMPGSYSERDTSWLYPDGKVKEEDQFNGYTNGIDYAVEEDVRPRSSSFTAGYLNNYHNRDVQRQPMYNAPVENIGRNNSSASKDYSGNIRKNNSSASDDYSGNVHKNNSSASNDYPDEDYFRVRSYSISSQVVTTKVTKPIHIPKQCLNSSDKYSRSAPLGGSTGRLNAPGDRCLVVTGYYKSPHGKYISYIGYYFTMFQSVHNAFLNYCYLSICTTVIILVNPRNFGIYTIYNAIYSYISFVSLLCSNNIHLAVLP